MNDAIEVRGQYNTAYCYVDQIDDATMSQVYSMVNNKCFEGQRIAIMPDMHMGKGSCIGFTYKITDKVIPNVVGVDIGCGVAAINLGNRDNIDFDAFDDHLRATIPMGTSIRNNTHPKLEFLFNKFLKTNAIDYKKFMSEVHRIIKMTGLAFDRGLNSIGTLGGGNHFQELNYDSDNNDVWYTVHSGSRKFGLEVATYHQKKAVDNQNYKKLVLTDRLVKEAKLNFEGKALEVEIKRIKKDTYISVPKGQEYLEGDLKDDYMNDLKIAQLYSSLNRVVMTYEMLDYFGLQHRIDKLERIESIHNFIGDDRIIRKGAISAYEGERVIIPLSMQHGVIIGTGKGNDYFNNSGPHGAGRTLSRSQANKTLDLDDMIDDMKGVWSSSICKGTIDESPRAYKDPEMIKEYLAPTVNVDRIMLPIYNIKDSSKQIVRK